MTTITETPTTHSAPAGDEAVQHEAVTEHSGPRKPRLPLWDNARFIAVVFVIIGHASLKLIAGSDAAYSLYLFVYLFQIPVFIAISGYFAHSGAPTRTQLTRIVTGLVLPYLIFETIWSGIHWAISGKLSLDYTTSWWTLWFLVALAAWRIVLPFLVLLRYPLIISVVISVAAGYIGTIDDQLSMARVIALLPFFVLGWKIKQWGLAERWHGLRTAAVWRWRTGAIALFGAVAVVLVAGIGTWRELLIRRFLLGDENYASFGYDQWWAGAVRLGLLFLSAVMCFGFLMLMPRGATVLSGLGQRTMYIYLLHSFLLYPLRESGLLDGHRGPLVLLGVVLFSISIAALLGLPIVKRIFRPLVEPRLTWLFSRPG